MTTEQSGSPLLRSVPEAQGVSSVGLLAFIANARETIQELHSFMLLRHGHVVAEGWWDPYAPEVPHMLFSLSKSFTSTAAGLAIAEGRLTLDSPVLSFFPDEAPAEVSDNLAAMQVRHLLSMSTGNHEDTLQSLRSDPDGNWVRAFLARPVEHAPGTHFVYNSGATYMVAAIVEKVTGTGLLDYLQPRLFEPLGIVGPTWETCPRGIAVGGWGLSVKTEDIARFGQLYLQKGVWNGVRLVPEAWVEAATSWQVANGDKPESDWSQGYGYQFWRSRHDAYRGDGAFGQFCIVMPEQDAVLAITAGTRDMQAELNVIWEYLVPAIYPEPLPADTEAYDELQRQLNFLTLRIPLGGDTSPLAASVSGKTYCFEPNEQKIEAVTLEFGANETVLWVRNAYGEHTILCGVDEWERSLAALDRPGPVPVAAIGAWTAEDTYTAKLTFYETPFCVTFICRYAADRLYLDYQLNVSFGPPAQAELIGKADTDTR
jgi:CubicO group peptidase (beta-lactamase class C family)